LFIVVSYAVIATDDRGDDLIDRGIVLDDRFIVVMYTVIAADDRRIVLIDRCNV
jgi:hypothetical protein